MKYVNIFVRELAQDDISASPDLAPTKLSVEDNVGESIHVHWRNLRMEMSIKDYQKFASEVTAAAETLDNGNY